MRYLIAGIVVYGIVFLFGPLVDKWSGEYAKRQTSG